MSPVCVRVQYIHVHAYRVSYSSEGADPEETTAASSACRVRDSQSCLRAYDSNVQQYYGRSCSFVSLRG